MTASVPQSITPSVAFEIPIEKKEHNGTSPLQKRLVAQANSPRRDANLADLNKKLSEASKRKEAIAVKTKTVSHNAEVKKVYEESIKREANGIEELEKHISSKLSKAEAKRQGQTTSWARRLSTTAKAKVRRAAKVKEDEKWQAKELEAKIDIKGMTAELRRVELKLKVQEELAVTNHDKLRRGQLALGLAEVEAKHIENHSKEKVAAANHRREMQQKEMLVLASARIGGSTAEKKEKAADARKQAEEEAAKRQGENEEKIKLAEERKQQVIDGRVENISTQMNEKSKRAADTRRQEEERTKEKGDHINAKIRLAEERRENIIREQQELLQAKSTQKERVVIDKQQQEEKSNMQRQKDIQSKLVSANARKEDILSKKAKAAKSDQQTKLERTKNSWNTSLNESKELKQTSEKRLKNAAERKDKILKEMVDEMQDVNKNKIDKVAKMNKSKELEDIQSLAEIEKRLAVASASRKNNLIAKSSSKKRMLSPRSSSTDKSEIEARINQANWRREIYLTNKVEKAKKINSSPKINKALFVAVSPKQSIEDSPREQQRIKASRLVQSSSTEEDEHKHHGLNVHLLAIGGIAVVLVGLLSFLKSK
eukprot:CAMPEP_0201936416 /NCGR_PEP_ID=MMETSP0903-20130614/37451_1 /ASSEMBLY_ACC=CAM_ASM_000552 /TAXON_ID=420261 /ORGANISM="Thalassiosira antarctica, Strain CCMP982" /LENGTH=598 /DNA_ID=CAMNT_0048477103 /DNA_START=27 /DNA_END=1823 /DNA_ORIENTATION=+